MSAGSDGPDPELTDPSRPRVVADSTEHEYRLRQQIGDGRRTITLRMPTGWVRATLSGVEAAVIGWAVPALIGILGLLAQGNNPWFQDIDMSSAASIGTDFWSLSLGAPMSVGGLPISLIPLLWTAIEVLILRGFLWSGRNNQAAAQWYAVPGYVLTAAVVLIASPGKASLGAVIMGSALVSLLAASWAVFSQTDKWPASFLKVPWLWRGLRAGMQGLGLVAVIGVVAAITSVVVNLDAMSGVSKGLGATGFSWFVLSSAQVSYLLVFAAWGVAWLAGPGFTLSGGSVQSPTSMSQGDLPAFPTAKAIPGTTPGNAVVIILVVAGIAAGALLGFWFRKKTLTMTEAGLTAVAALLFFSSLIGAWFALSTGALGSELMARLGPAPTAWPMVALEFGATAALVAFLVQGDAIKLAQDSWKKWTESTAAKREATAQGGGTGMESRLEEPEKSPAPSGENADEDAE